MDVKKFIGMAFRKISACWAITLMGIICFSLIVIVTMPILIPLLGPALGLLAIFSSPAIDWMDKMADNLLKH